MSICPSCNKRPKQKHLNSKWCLPCALQKRKRPVTTMTKQQISSARKMIGKMPRDEIAQELGVSLSSLKRAFRGTRLVFHNKYVANPSLVKRVCKYYEKHGNLKTQEMFPDINLRSIIERYPNFSPRQKRWTNKELKELVQMAGLVSMKAQAKYFNRPGANIGSIRSAWTKKFGIGASSLHGMPWYQAKYIVSSRCPSVEKKFWHQRREHQGKLQTIKRTVFLWVDMEHHLSQECPEYIAEAIRSMAEFQRWVFGVKDVKSKIRRIIKEREL